RVVRVAPVWAECRETEAQPVDCRPRDLLESDAYREVAALCDLASAAEAVESHERAALRVAPHRLAALRGHEAAVSLREAAASLRHEAAASPHEAAACESEASRGREVAAWCCEVAAWCRAAAASHHAVADS